MSRVVLSLVCALVLCSAVCAEVPEIRFAEQTKNGCELYAKGPFQNEVTYNHKSGCAPSQPGQGPTVSVAPEFTPAPASETVDLAGVVGVLLAGVAGAAAGVYRSVKAEVKS